MNELRWIHVWKSPVCLDTRLNHVKSGRFHWSQEFPSFPYDNMLFDHVLSFHQSLANVRKDHKECRFPNILTRFTVTDWLQLNSFTTLQVNKGDSCLQSTEVSGPQLRGQRCQMKATKLNGRIRSQWKQSYCKIAYNKENKGHWLLIKSWLCFRQPTHHQPFSLGFNKDSSVASHVSFVLILRRRLFIF